MLIASEPRPNPDYAAPAGGADAASEGRLPDSYFMLKTMGDGLASLVLLVLTAPLLLLSMLLVKLTSRGPALYSQTRLGRNGKPFTIYKIRTMVHECESLTGARWSTPGDSRVTKIGRWLRTTHLDELPQLWNVLRGDMSLVGPRPERPEFVPHLEQAIPLYRERLQVRPGVTGLAQVQLPPDTDLDSVRTKLAYDLHYVQTMSFWLDVRICLATAFKMAGVPFRALRWLFAFPAKESIERTYQKLQTPSSPRETTMRKHEGPLPKTEPVPVMS